MILIVCVEDRMGQAFHQRRLSRDRALSARVAAQAKGGTLRMSPYSKPLFEDAACLLAEEDYLDRAGEGERCFVELEDVTPYKEKVEKIILYRWNRPYPSDVKFSLNLQNGSWRLLSTTNFAGNSHEKITEEIYEKV